MKYNIELTERELMLILEAIDEAHFDSICFKADAKRAKEYAKLEEKLLDLDAIGCEENE